jgi:hypothetical protein
MIMVRKPDFKMGISIGPLKGQREFATDIEHPPFAVLQANDYIHENYDPGMSIFIVDENSPQRRKSRSRQ